MVLQFRLLHVQFNLYRIFSGTFFRYITVIISTCQQFAFCCQMSPCPSTWLWFRVGTLVRLFSRQMRVLLSSLEPHFDLTVTAAATLPPAFLWASSKHAVPSPTKKKTVSHGAYKDIRVNHTQIFRHQSVLKTCFCACNEYLTVCI